MKKLLLLSVFFSYALFSQTLKKVKIADAETGAAIPNARIILANQIFYSNDDGLISLPKEAKQFEVSVAGYETLKSAKQQSTIKLKPLYNDIDEIKIVSIDIKKIFKEVSKNYADKYYDKPAVYDITFRQKSFENNQMKLLIVADGQYWTRDGSFNSKEAFHKKFDNFVQMQIDNLRYLKSEKRDFDIKVKPQKGYNEFIGNLFFNYELHRIISLSNQRKAVTSARVLYEDENHQEISFKVKTDVDLIYIGTVIYNKLDRVITHYQMIFEQKNHEPREYRDETGEIYKFQYPDGIFTFDFYKNGEKYVPSRTSINYEGSKYMQGDRSFEYQSSREIIYKKFKPSDANGLKNPVEINEPFWGNMKVSDDKGFVDLSQEEQNFINDKKDEN